MQTAKVAGQREAVLQHHAFRQRLTLGKILIYLFLIALAVLCVIPFYLMLIYSTHNNASIASSFTFLPGTFLLDNYVNMASKINIWRGFANSFFIAGSSTVLSLYIGALTAYGFAKFHFKGRTGLFLFLLATMMVPGQLALIGVYRLFSTLGLLDSYAAIILPAAANAFNVFFIKQFMESSIPDEIIESSRVDGASEFRTFNQIVLPILGPAISALGIFTFIGSWNNFLTPLVLFFSLDKYPLPVLVALVQGYYGMDYGLLYLGVAISILPIIVVFAVFSKQIIGSVALGAVKG
ncbi:carbohydrate ABC transporter permease [Paenibacillus barcinonensis]|uniref:Carbohydrate ABC transporter membrane protein 2 (CUT1 family) n=1 Tax=Paenibacillus barcinonensis TaxID=198119 RepID=A0A2V4VTW4_PAEBA|nr:carbohydrate ABC transporter permease [Paenibacillus barcinonensis]PYE50371.1 carbohydrate ABC transporter membrane protein 2 (CUT1 family) [Paenibacillus barcinonensis]QKS55045.1 carbohydrate ABC transporter permease [Paenibacillus barcinonensis]